MFGKRFMPVLGLLATMIAWSSVAAQDPVECPDVTWDLIAGQHYDVGSITVTNDSTNLYVTYTLDPDVRDTRTNAICVPTVDPSFGTLHLWVGDNDPTGAVTTMPKAGNGAPIPGQFPYQFDASGLQTHTFTIPLSELGITDVFTACDKTLYVVAHAEISVDSDCDGDLDSETGFGGNLPGTGSRWWFYGAYAVCCDDGVTPVPFCQTAYAKGGYIWTTDKKSNPEKLPSLNLTKNRWGWAIKLTAPGETTYPIWAGAGLNDTTKGIRVGTLTVNWDGTNVAFCYDLDEDYTIQELHVYTGDDAPTTIAPGQYGYIQDFNDAPVEDWCDSLPLADANGGGVWVVAHAVVCFED
jgi:hypothetical protein